MRSKFIYVSVFTLFSSSAMAADLEQASAFDWSGLYAGAFASYTSLNSDTSLGAVSDDIDLDGFGGGVLMGYNHQMDNIVFGVEADIALHDIDGSSTVPAAHTQDIDFTYGARLRLGYAMDTTLLFLQGGIAAAEFDADLAGGASIASDTLLGFQVGAGIEHAFAESWSVRADYLYSNYESVTGNPPVNFDPDGHSIRVGVNYLF